ncbi:histidine kinase [Thiocapsa rosea]|uniref:Sensor protein n=1 Tax=Thiocapsa rosea TaxID=69360 RepID=A0A495V719_9GAMM|nr:histidine kinase [Thiocapsa rosea]RKT45181.1 two-component system nitrate/nitrite sensor histidine kinase NarX [Thiocapsa rosea]
MSLSQARIVAERGEEIEASRVREVLRAAGLAMPLVVLGAALAAAIALLTLQGARPHLGWTAPLAMAALVGASLAGLFIWSRLRSQLLLPLVRLEHSLSRVCQGEPGASDALDDAGVLAQVARDIRSLNEELTDLYEEMDNRVARQTMRLAQKTASLKILYDVAAGIHQAESVDELLLRFLRVLKEMINGRAATVRLVMPDGSRRLVGAIGLDDDLVREQDIGPVDLCLCGSVLTPGEILCGNDARYCSRIYGRRMFASSEMEVVTVPLEHRDELLGVYTVFVDRPGLKAREDILDLLATVGHHLGVAIAKLRSDADARRLSIVEERNSLAHELHDSLAQTLASLRFQCRMLTDSLRGSAISLEARNDLSRIRNGLDEAHTELRELLASFRAPLDRRGLVPALEKLTHRFGQETGAHVLFQNDCRPFELSASEELQILRIVQESLANIRKHSKAHTVRVMLARESNGQHVLLIEDDGVGFSTPAAGSNPGEHIGLTIMEERARRIGAELRIESEAGEGTRVEVIFDGNRRTTRQGSVAA